MLKTSFVDIYSRYMYFDEANIEQMSKIIALKELGLELNEINNLDSKLVHNKIEEYEEKVKKLIDNIHTLKTLSIENGGVRNLKSFINDELAIGKWALKEMYDNISDYPNNPIDFDLGIKELYLMPKGEEYWVVSWTKGNIYISGRANKYEIKDDKCLFN